MGYQLRKLTWEESVEGAKKYPYCLAYMMSDIYLGAVDTDKINWEELLEGRFFSEKRELHIFRLEKNWRAVEILDEEPSGSQEQTEEMVKSYLLDQKRYQGIGKGILVKEYLTEDEDGQVYAELTRLCGIR